jgi:hypothetical protein
VGGFEVLFIVGQRSDPRAPESVSAAAHVGLGEEAEQRRTRALERRGAAWHERRLALRTRAQEPAVLHLRRPRQAPAAEHVRAREDLRRVRINYVSAYRTHHHLRHVLGFTCLSVTSHVRDCSHLRWRQAPIQALFLFKHSKLLVPSNKALLFIFYFDCLSQQSLASQICKHESKY